MKPASAALTLFLCGDVMTGRGIDHVLPCPCAPHLYEPCVKHASGYVQLAESTNGPIPRPISDTHIWGDALTEFENRRPALKIINLETSVTISEEAAPKGINYRMNPKNIGCITSAKIDCCMLSNNHVLDWGYPGLQVP